VISSVRVASMSITTARAEVQDLDLEQIPRASRHRHGTYECDQDCLRADELEHRVVECLLATHATT
jgi:hypothetical protein